MSKKKPDKEPAEKAFIITRVFDAPRERVWKAWTEADQLKRWFGPKGFAMLDCKMDLRPGGVCLYGLRAPDGLEMWGKWVFREIVRPERIVLIQSFSNKEGGITRHPLNPTWPLETLATTIFEERDGKTTVTVRWAPFNATEPERKTFADGHESMRQGWTGTLDQLTGYLRKA